MKHYNVLFLCTGNSARSIMAEAILNHLGAPNFTAFSAGSHPSGTVRPEALAQIAAAGIRAESFRSKSFRSKSWDEFSGPAAPQLDFIFTVCDNAANETCPLWPGHPVTAHWGVPDPVASGDIPREQAKAYQLAFSLLQRRITLLLALPLASIDALSLKKELDRIGQQ